jgi:tRNA-2-methylthio-N6-dimethylallyladenosine synthase
MNNNYHPWNEATLTSIDLTTTPPLTEPDRQYYYIARCRQLIAQRSAQVGRPLTARVENFGCQMNARDAEKLAGILTAVGYITIDSEEADFVIYNTCTVRDNANQRIYGRLGHLGTRKKNNPQMKIALCGCMMQEPAVIEKIKTSYRFVNLIFGTHNIFKFAELLTAMHETGDQIIDIWTETEDIVEALPTERKYSFKSGINIMFGCNNFCSYCIVPYVRGRERSRHPEEIIAEIKSLVAGGVIEIMLLGQNVNSYGIGLTESVDGAAMDFPVLLRLIEAIPGLERIRFMTSHPKDLSDELIAVMSTSTKICHHLHLPLQSGSTSILTAMNRRYTKEQYLLLAAKIRRAIPDIALTTDIIVGFPGETAADIDETIDVVRTVGFDNAFTFIYSPRTGTPAAAMPDQLTTETVKVGFDRLLKAVQETARMKAGELCGQTMKGLVEEVSEADDTLLTARLSNNNVVHFPGSPSLIGTIVDIKLTECHGFYYLGEQVQ